MFNKYIKVSIVSLTLLAVCSCSMGRTSYGLASTKRAGIFYKETSFISKASQKKTNIYEKTKLDHLIEGMSAPVDDTKYALVIGIEQYKQQADVNYAKNSAKTFTLAAKNLLGIPAENILYLDDADATSGQIKANLALIQELTDPGDSIYIFFAGHGVPDNSGNTYILPTDMSADTIHLEPQLMLSNIYQSLSKSNANRVYVFIDSCFSGKNDDGDLLFKGVAPVFKKKLKQFSSSKLTVMTAGGPNDFANQYIEEKQRLFSYFLIKGLINQNENIDDLYKYVRKSVKKNSLKIGLGYKQIPQLQRAK